ncbi:hypothetical protein [Polaribacter sp. Hel_I_88]|uniref:hypothetical protein n=1 Tax=Polaribacter sp. Hel_I_88 TaxID=1250006 RepID=UPI0004790D55|nr:hypothetical protein [Polaribacter sp. Hel_I_88]
MKNLILILLLFTFSKLFSQNIPINLASSKNYKEATIYFKDGSSKIGFADYNSLANSKVKFKESLDGKRKNYDSRKVKRLDFNLDSTSYYYKKIGNTRKFVLLKLLKKGESMSLYTALHKETDTAPFSGNSNGLGISIYNKKASFYETYYFAKNNDDKAFFFYNDTKSLRFKKSIRKYFSNCPKFVDKIDNNEFGKEDIIKVVDFYNEECK